jgi:cbb3-type cytochrome oxidase maturation protein
MNAVLVTIPLVLFLMVLAVGFFFWAVNHDQFDDLETPSLLPLDEEPGSQRPDEGAPP